MYSWQNDTRCRDGVKVLWCRSHLVWSVFEDFIPTCACLHLANLFVSCFCCFFFVNYCDLFLHVYLFIHFLLFDRRCVGSIWKM